MKRDLLPQSAVEAWDLVLPFFTGLMSDPTLTVSKFLSRSVPQIKHQRFDAAVTLLEEHHGVTLYHRARLKQGRNRITREGRRLVSAWLAIRDPASSARPELRVAVFSFAMTTFLGDAIAAYLRDEGAIDADFTFREYRDLRSALEALTLGRVECVFGVKTQAHLTKHYDNATSYRAVSHSFTPVLVYPAATERIPDPRRLEREVLIVPRTMPSEWEGLVRKAPHLTPGRRITVDSFLEVLQLVRNGTGCGLLPGVFKSCLTEPPQSNTVGFLPWPGGKSLPYGVFLPAAAEEEGFDPTVRQFVDGVMSKLDSPAYFVPPKE